MPDVAKAKTLLEKAKNDCGTAKGIADAHGNYAAAKRRIDTVREEIKKMPADRKTLVVKELERIDTQVEQATAKAEIDKKPQEAIPLLEKAQKDLDQARVKLDMHTTLNSASPNPEFLKLLAKEPGGTKILDDMVGQLGEDAPRNVLEAALEARFVGINLEQHLSKNLVNLGTDAAPNFYHGTADKQAPDKSVKRIYDLLKKVPDKHVVNNDQIKLIRRFQEDTGGGSHNAFHGRVDLYAGRAGSTTSSDQGAQLCSPEYFPDGVDPDCQPSDEAKKKDVRYFDWATLHEVGHAVDEKQGVMKNHGHKAEFGGWKIHPDSTEAAKACQKKFNFDLTYIKNRLAYNSDRIQRAKTPPPAGGPAPLPEPGLPVKPADRDTKEWEATKKKVDAWCASVMGLRLWWDGGGTKNVAVDGVVHQMSYDWPEWVSYNLDARKQGIHGYQFRAPGEWFAEIYAAYYMDLLKPEHPVVKAIKKTVPDAMADRE